MIGNANDGCLDIASIVRFELSPFSDILVNLTVWDPNLKVFSGKFLKPHGLGTSAVGRSDHRYDDDSPCTRCIRKFG